VLAHGLTDDGLCWTPVAEALEPEYDVIMVDARGHGLSDAPERGYDSATQAADLQGLVAGLGLEKPLVLGHSMGSTTALVLAGIYPDVPAKILLEDPPGFWVAPLAPAAGASPPRPDLRAWFAQVKGKTREELIAEQRGRFPSWSDAELGPWADAKLRFSLNIASIFGFNPSTSLDWPATLGRITCPVLLITGDPALGSALSPEGAAALQAMVPQVQVTHIAGAGHNIRREQFARYMEVVRDFLA
jgi:N-formylmaleamate deformylase